MEGLELFFDKLGLLDLTIQSIILRIALATVASGMLGLERSKKRRAAGFRTYIMVCLGACVIMMTGQYILDRFGQTDVARLGAQVISGIGFLGAGTIIVTGGSQIKGLTTAASLWAAACMGIAIGIGFYIGAVLMCAIMLLVLSAFNYLETRYISRSKNMNLFVVLSDMSNIGDMLKLCRDNKIEVMNYETTRIDYASGLGAVFYLHFPEKKPHHEMMDLLRTCDGLLYMEER